MLKEEKQNVSTFLRSCYPNEICPEEMDRCFPLNMCSHIKAYFKPVEETIRVSDRHFIFLSCFSDDTHLSCPDSIFHDLMKPILESITRSVC